MSTNLTSGERRVLQQWGVKVKQLLHKASSDGCSPAIFHQKCDSQGPTLVLLHNTAGFVFGGCTFQSWTSGGGSYVNDPEAFLFRLKKKSSFAPLLIPVKSKGENAIFCHQNYGPTFGGHDVLTFTNQTFNRVNDAYFPLNGSTNLGNAYKASGLKAASFCGSDFNVLDVQVYSIQEYQEPMKHPWRDFLEESSETLLRQWVLDYQPVEEAKVKRSNLLLLGPVGSGKSSFFNTVNSAFRGYVTAQAGSGSAEHSLTTTYRTYRLREAESGQALKFRLCDTMGLEEGLGLDSNDITAILDGHVRDRYKFNPLASITPASESYRKYPKLEKRIHCVVFVMDSCSLDDFPEKILQRMQDARVQASRRAIPQAVLLTKVDKLCALVEENVGDTFRSPAVEEAVEQAAKLVGLPRGRVLPVKNYEKELELEPEVDRLALTALRAALRLADDNIENRLEEAEGACGSSSSRD